MSLIISDQAKLKLSSIHNNSWDICLVVDFDGTLTKYFDENGKSRPSIISLLRDEWVLDENYSIKAKEMYSKYSAIEHNKELPFDVRNDAMNERWTTHKELLITKWLTKQHIDHIVSLDKMVMRPRTDQLLQQAKQHNNPVIIFSASGIGVNTIHLLLDRWWLLYDNIHIVSNELYRDKSWVMNGYSTPLIHSLNKTESVFDDPKYINLKQITHNHTNFIVIGDGMGDAEMIADLPSRTVLRVWLCNDKIEERLTNYQEKFDIVITHDDGFSELLQQLI